MTKHSLEKYLKKKKKNVRAVDASLLGEVLGPVQVLEGLFGGDGSRVGQAGLHDALQTVHGARAEGAGGQAAVERVVTGDGGGQVVGTAAGQCALVVEEAVEM